MNKFLILFLLTIYTVKALAQCGLPPSQPASGMGCDIPVGSCVASATDGSKATCTWTTVHPSDSQVTFVDGFSNGAHTQYNATMTTTHTINVVNLAPGTVFKYYLSSCTHVTYLSPGVCPLTSIDWSSTGPASRMAQPLPSFTTIARQTGGPLSSWYTFFQTPSNVFKGQEFFINSFGNVSIGTLGTAAGAVNFLLLHDITITTPTGTSICGFNNTAITPNYMAYGDTSFNVACTANNTSPPPLPTDQDFIIVPLIAANYSPLSPNGLNTTTVVSGSSGVMSTIGQAGYFYNAWPGTGWSFYVKVGANVPAGNYVINYQLQPLFSDGTGNRTGDSPSLLSQNKTISVPITVMALTPLTTSAPSSFPPWSFEGQFMAMAAYWGTWACSNITDVRNGKGPMALYYNSGVYENVAFSINTWGEWPWNYDGTRNYLALADRLFSTSHAAWLASHTYAIGELITVSGTTFMVNAVNGTSSPGLSGTSGTAQPPSFLTNTTPGANVFDNNIQWMSVGDRNYWHGCALQAGDGYRNNILMMQGTNLQEPDMFPTGILQQFYRTLDASPGNETGHTYQENDGRFGGLKGISSSFAVPASCKYPITPQQQGFATYWTGGSQLALCYAASTLAQWANITNSNNLGQTRIRANQLQNEIAYWMAYNNPDWINTSDGLRTQRMVESALDILDMFMNMSSDNFPAGSPNLGVIASYYQSSQISEALIHYYQAEQYYSNLTSFPCPSGGYTVCVTPDERIPRMIKTFADWQWLNMFDRIYDKNEVLADACFPAQPLCHSARRLHSYSFPYNHWTLSEFSIQNEFNTESASNGEDSFIYAWLFARDSTLVPPSNGRIVVSSYRDIFQVIMQHAYDGRSCSTTVGSTVGNCTSWGIPDYFNGGRATGIGYNNLVNGSKTIQQTSVNTLSEGLPWANGIFTASQGAMTRSTNPCWNPAARNPDGSCSSPQPFPDVQQPYPMNFAMVTGRPAVQGPSTICRPGAVGNSKSSICLQANPTGTLGTNGFGTNQVPVNGGAVTVSNTFATFNFMTVENATCSLVADTPLVEPAHVLGVNYWNESLTHTPTLAGGTPLPLWFHSITAQPLTPSTTYRFGIYCSDSAAIPANNGCASTGNCFNYPYQIGGTTGKFAMQFGSGDQAQTFTTTALPTGNDTVTWPGVTHLPGVLIK